MTRFVFVVSSLLAVTLCQALAGQPAKDSPAPRGFLGVAVEPATDKDEGVVVQEVLVNSPAAKAGLRIGDVVLKIQGQPIKNVEQFLDGVAARKPGEKISVQVRRDGKEQTLDATLGERPAPPRRLPGQPGGGAPGLRRAAFLGVHVEPLSAERRKQLNVKGDGGVAITEVVADSPAARAGLQRDDVLTSIDSQPVMNPADLRAAVQKAGPGREVTVHVQRGGAEKTLKASLQEGPISLMSGQEIGRFPAFDVESLWDHHSHVQGLQRRIEMLEKRLNELEKKVPPSK